MDENYIPLAKEVSGSTYEMVDRFSSYAEALSIPVVDNKRESFIAVARHILKKTTKQKHDVDNLFGTLQKVTLTLVGERLKQFPMTEFTKHRLPELTRLQKQAAGTKVQSFDEVWIERIKNRSLQIRQLIERHETRLRKLIAAQESCWKAESKCKFESAARTNLRKMSQQLCNSVKNVISERLSYGIGCLRGVIAGFSDVDKYEECLRLLGEIDLQKIVTSILTASSEKYICPRINEFIETHGFKTHLPAGKIVPGTDVISDNIGNNDGKTNTKTKKKQSKPKEELEITKADSQHSKSDETDIRQEEEDAPLNITNPDIKKDPDTSDDEQEISVYVSNTTATRYL